MIKCSFCWAVDVTVEVWGGAGAPLACWHLFYAIKLAFGGLALRNTFHQMGLGCHVPHANWWINSRLPDASWINRNIHHPSLCTVMDLPVLRSITYYRLQFTFGNKFNKKSSMGVFQSMREKATTRVLYTDLSSQHFRQGCMKYSARANSDAMLDWLKHCGSSRGNLVNLQAVNGVLKWEPLIMQGERACSAVIR